MGASPPYVIPRANTAFGNSGGLWGSSSTPIAAVLPSAPAQKTHSPSLSSAVNGGLSRGSTPGPVPLLLVDVGGTKNTGLSAQDLSFFESL